MRRQQSGFTLIELVIVIVILGVLAALAVPRFVNLQDDAQAAALNGNASALTSAMNINYAGCAVLNNKATAGQCVAVDNCDDYNSVLTTALAVADYEVTAAAIAGVDGTSATCTLEQKATSLTKTFTAIKAGNAP